MKTFHYYYCYLYKRYLFSKLSNVAIRTTFYIFVAKINHGQIRNYIRFNFGCFIFLSFPFYLTIVIVFSCKTRLADCKLPCNSEICNCSLS